MELPQAGKAPAFQSTQPEAYRNAFLNGHPFLDPPKLPLVAMRTGAELSGASVRYECEKESDRKSICYASLLLNGKSLRTCA